MCGMVKVAEDQGGSATIAVRIPLTDAKKYPQTCVMSAGTAEGLY